MNIIIGLILLCTIQFWLPVACYIIGQLIGFVIGVVGGFLMTFGLFALVVFCFLVGISGLTNLLQYLT